MNKSQKQLQLSIEEITRQEIGKARENARKYIESALLSIIGLEKKYSNEYEIDHCNGRASLLIDAFRETAKEEARKIAADYKPTKSELDIFKKSFKDEVSRNMRYALQEAARARANQLANEITEKVKIDADKLIAEEFNKKV